MKTPALTYDIIGDIHGCADQLRALLAKLGYEERNGAYSATNRKAIFVGDFIDRGPKVCEVLQIARAMVTREAAFALIGNHEFNALCYHAPDGAGGFLRSHTKKNTHQHQATIDQLVLPYPEEWHSYLEWFKGLPLFLEVEGLRVVHAAWDENAIRAVRGRSFHDPDFLWAAARKGTPEFGAIDTLLKGPEIKLPEGKMCTDKEGMLRNKLRLAWWKSPPKKKRVFYRDVAVPSATDISEELIPAELRNSIPTYSRRDPPVLFGHYSLRAEAPAPLESNATCLDYTVAQGGFLAAYSWSGEKRLKPDRFTVSK